MNSKRVLLPCILTIAACGLAAAPAFADDDDDRPRTRHGNVSIDWIIADAKRRYPGRVTDVEYDDGKYEIEIRQRRGREVELEYSARTGRLLDVDFDD